MTGSGCGNPLSKSATDIAHYNLPPRLGGDVLWLLPNLPGLALSSFSADTRSAAEGNTMLCSVGCVCGIRSEDTPSSFKNDSRLWNYFESVTMPDISYKRSSGIPCTVITVYT